MALLTASVGAGGVNNKPDVLVIEYLLNRVILQIYPPTAAADNGRVSFEEAVINVIPVDGKIDDGVIRAIREYQRRILGFKYPDGRVDPGKNTIRALTRSFIAQGGVIAIQPQQASREVNPTAVYDHRRGGPYRTGILKAGQIVAGLDGNRLILNISARETTFLLLDNAGPGSEMADLNPMRGQVGTVYRQKTAAFLDERDSMYFQKIAQSLQGVKALVELEMGIMLAIFSGTSTAGLVLVMGTSGLNFIIENREKFPKWASAVSTVLSVRATLKRYAPTLYEKMCKGLFIGVKRGTLVAISLAGDDVVGNLPQSMVKDPMTAGKLVGALVASLTKAGLAKRLTMFGAVFAILKTLVKQAAMGIPGAVGITAGQKIAAARDIVARLQAAGVFITQAEAHAIIDEVEQNAREVRGALDDLARAFQEF
jgi:hypothetical protein